MTNKRALWLDPIVTTALALMPLTFVVRTRFDAVLYVILLVSALAGVIRSPRVRRACGEARAVLWPFACFLPLSLLSVVLNHSQGKATDNGAHFLLFVLLAPAFLYLRPRIAFWWGLTLAALVTGGVALVQRYGLHIERPYGLYGTGEIGSGAIKFGMVSAVLVLLSAISALRRDSAPWVRAVHAVGSLLALVAVCLSDSRGPLLALVVAMLCLMPVYIEKFKVRHLLAGLLAAAVALAGVTFLTTMGARLLEIFSQVSAYAHHDMADTSVGARLAMWSAAWRLFLAHPVFGVGINQFGDYLRMMIAHGQAPSFVSVFDHAHNEYVEYLAVGGVVGFAWLLWAFVAPIAYFARRLRHGLSPAVDRQAAIGGLATALAFPLFALTDNIFDRQMTTSLYAFLVLGFAMLSTRAGALSPSPDKTDSIT